MTSIITGDIINSRDIPTNKWLDVLKSTLLSIGTSPKNWEIFRGDSFQLETEIENAFRVCLIIKSNLKSISNIDVRLAIGLGEKNFEDKSITQSNGEAFINSGFAFDNLLKNQNLAIKTPWDDFDKEFNVSFALALIAMDHWSTTSAEFVKTTLLNPNLNQKELGNILKVSQAGISKTKKRACLHEILRLEQRFQDRLKLINQ